MSTIQAGLDLIIPFLKQQKIPFHIAGGFGAHLLGASRPINDIDIDVPNKYVPVVFAEFSRYSDFPPQRYHDTTWDIFLATLNYDGQLIDLGGADDALIHSKLTGQWEPIRMDLSKVVWIHAFGHDLPVQNPADLMDYKSKIKYDEEKHIGDVEAIRGYIAARQA